MLWLGTCGERLDVLSFCLVPLESFEDIGLWVWNFPSKVRTIVAARVVALIGII
jgi:hypothetical protein